MCFGKTIRKTPPPSPFLEQENDGTATQQLTRAQFVIQQHGSLPTDLAAKETACLDREGVVMTHLQVGHFKEIVSSIPEVSSEIQSTVKHVYLIALQTRT